ncbi:MAG: Gfo/Idh/MocA family protein [Limisphaerales bacterium]
MKKASAASTSPPRINRRHFLRVTAAASLPWWFTERLRAEDAPARPRPNDRPGIALIGCGGMGIADARAAARFGDVVAVCDVDRNHREAAARQLTVDGKTPDPLADFRRVMERDDVHVIINGTPDHWHTLINLAAANAKKDIYAEKPLTHSIDEGRRIIAAVRKNRVVLQTGTQQRSSHRFRLACELVRNGRIGRLQRVQVFVPAGLREGPFAAAQKVPPELNWDFWLGPAPQADYQRERCHGSFRWWYDYAGGPVTDWGAHHNDIARWAIGQDGPLRVEARALVEPIPGGYTTPPEFEATLHWAGGIEQIVRTTTADAWNGAILQPDGQRNGVRFEGTDGWLWVNRGDLEASNEDILFTPLPDNALKLESSRDHMENFFACVRSRKDPVCPVETGHRSASVGHLIVAALRTGKRLEFDPVKEVFTGEHAGAGNAHLARAMRAPYDYEMAG